MPSETVAPDTSNVVLPQFRMVARGHIKQLEAHTYVLLQFREMDVHFLRGGCCEQLNNWSCWFRCSLAPSTFMSRGLRFESIDPHCAAALRETPSCHLQTDSCKRLLHLYLHTCMYTSASLHLHRSSCRRPTHLYLYAWRQLYIYINIYGSFDAQEHFVHLHLEWQAYRYEVVDAWMNDGDLVVDDATTGIKL